MPLIQNARVVRLNAEKFPVSATERKMLARYGVALDAIEVATPKDLISHVKDAHAVCVVSSSIPKEVVDCLDGCLLISRLGIGTDKIDVARATERGIVVSNTPNFCTNEMADHVMAMVLSLAREIPRMSVHLRAGRFKQAHRESLALRRLSIQTLGLIGWGDSAKAVARRALSFGMQVIATRRDTGVFSPEANKWGVTILGLEELLERADFVSLHLPLTNETRGLVNRDRLSRMKKGAYLINVSRGEIVDEVVLAEFLDNGHLGGAGIDTFGFVDVFGETEDFPNHPLMSADNLIATPHVSALSVEATRDAAVGSVRNLVSVLNGYLPHPDNVVNPNVVPRSPLKQYDHSILEG